MTTGLSRGRTANQPLASQTEQIIGRLTLEIAVTFQNLNKGYLHGRTPHTPQPSR